MRTLTRVLRLHQIDGEHHVGKVGRIGEPLHRLYVQRCFLQLRYRQQIVEVQYRNVVL